ncbi:hypothetical protein EV426DRAFT_343321 [Tirmania nivea]|nr:hypothetical protein EV426DRAFT_343321 [Tirmania nivea]
MRASTVLVALASLAATTMATEYTVPTTTGISVPSGVPVPSPNGTSNGTTHTPTPSADGAGSVLAPASMIGLTIAGVAIAIGGAVF